MKDKMMEELAERMERESDLAAQYGYPSRAELFRQCAQALRNAQNEREQAIREVLALPKYTRVQSPELKLINCDDIRALLPTKPEVEPVRETRRIYKDSKEYPAYLKARFAEGTALSISFLFEGRRWKYEHTDFDERGDFDLLLAANQEAEPTKPEPTQAGGLIPIIIDQGDIDALKKECDRSWEDETPHQVIMIAANALYWRKQEIVRLNAALASRGLQSRTPEGNDEPHNK